MSREASYTASLRFAAAISAPTTGPANVAVTERAALIVTVQVAALPEQAPLQDWKEYPLPGNAVSVTNVSGSKSSRQSVPQRTPAGEELTAPRPMVATDSR